MPAQVDSALVLWGQAIIYTLYAFAVLVVVGAFGYKVTRNGTSREVPTWFFATWAVLLVVAGVSLHLTTANTIPWVPMDLDREAYAAERKVEIVVGDHAFRLPEEPIAIDCNDTVLFSVDTEDLTYGFGLFRQDHSMVFQMQVVPGHPNEILWRFEKDGVYDIRSTEYSGPAGHKMIVPGAVVVTGCGQEEPR